MARRKLLAEQGTFALRAEPLCQPHANANRARLQAVPERAASPVVHAAATMESAGGSMLRLTGSLGAPRGSDADLNVSGVRRHTLLVRLTTGVQCG